MTGLCKTAILFLPFSLNLSQSDLGMAIKPFRIYSSPSRALKGHGSKGSWAGFCHWRGALCFPVTFQDLLTEECSMLSDYAKDRIIEIIAVVELSLILIGFIFYYLYIAPQQNRCERVVENKYTNTALIKL